TSTGKLSKRTYMCLGMPRILSPCAPSMPLQASVNCFLVTGTAVCLAFRCVRLQNHCVLYTCLKPKVRMISGIITRPSALSKRVLSGLTNNHLRVFAMLQLDSRRFRQCGQCRQVVNPDLAAVECDHLFADQVI